MQCLVPLSISEFLIFQLFGLFNFFRDLLAGLGRIYHAVLNKWMLKTYYRSFQTEIVKETRGSPEFFAADDTQLGIQAPSFLFVHNRLYLALFDGEQAEIVSKNILTLNYFVVPLSISTVSNTCSKSFEAHTPFDPPSLRDIFEFDQIASSLERKYPRTKLVFQTGSDRDVQIKMAFLIGCHMIMSHGLELDETIQCFRGMHSLFESKTPNSSEIVSVLSCWHAFYCAKCLNWMGLDRFLADTTQDDHCIHIEEYLHYAR